MWAARIWPPAIRRLSLILSSSIWILNLLIIHFLKNWLSCCGPPEALKYLKTFSTTRLFSFFFLCLKLLMVSNKSPNLGLEYFMASDSHLTHSPAWVVMMGFMYWNVCISSFDKGQGIPIYRKFLDADAPQTCLAYFFFFLDQNKQTRQEQQVAAIPPKSIVCGFENSFHNSVFSACFSPIFLFFCWFTSFVYPMNRWSFVGNIAPVQAMN